MIDETAITVTQKDISPCPSRTIHDDYLHCATSDGSRIPDSECDGDCETVPGCRKLDHSLPHCRYCQTPMRPGTLRTDRTGPNMRAWICEACQRAEWYIDQLQDARVRQRVWL